MQAAPATEMERREDLPRIHSTPPQTHTTFAEYTRPDPRTHPHTSRDSDASCATDRDGEKRGIAANT
ncbi:Hypothetical predicted protein, partial [Olea europaea subsp. europaea]